MLAAGYFWRSGHETQTPVRRRRGDGRVRGGAGGDGDGAAGDYHVVQLLCAPLSLFLSLSDSVRLPGKSSGPLPACFYPASLDDITVDQPAVTAGLGRDGALLPNWLGRSCACQAASLFRGKV